MPSYPRHRDRALGHHTTGYYRIWSQKYLHGIPYGEASYVGRPEDGSTYRTISEDCDDFVSEVPYPDNDLDLVRKTVNPGYVSGEFVLTYPSSTGWSSKSWIEANKASPSLWVSDSNCPAPAAGNWQYWKAKALANADPGKPIVDVPLFLWELREFPRMLRDFGDVLRGVRDPSMVPGGFLAYQFGWAPLLDDVRRLINFGHEFEKRVNYLNKISTSKRTKRVIGNITRTSTSGYGAAYGVTYTWSRKTRIKVWYTLDWYIPDEIAWAADVERILSVRDLLGLRHVSAATIWEGIPWSWLIDYFSNLGDVLEVLGNRYAAHPKKLCVMQGVTRTDTLVPITNYYGFHLAPPVMETREKTRRAYTDVTTVRPWMRPILSDGQLNILAALALAGPARAYHGPSS